jgi:PKD repeat protein
VTDEGMGTKHRALATVLAFAFVVSGMTSLLLIPNGVRAADPVYHDDFMEHDNERPIGWTIYDGPATGWPFFVGSGELSATCPGDGSSMTYPVALSGEYNLTVRLYTVAYFQTGQMTTGAIGLKGNSSATPEFTAEPTYTTSRLFINADTSAWRLGSNQAGAYNTTSPTSLFDYSSYNLTFTRFYSEGAWWELNTLREFPSGAIVLQDRLYLGPEDPDAITHIIINTGTGGNPELYYAQFGIDWMTLYDTAEPEVTEPDPEPSVLDASFTFIPGEEQLQVNFDPTQHVYATYMWGFGDGSTSTEVVPSHVYAEPGTYNVTLMVSKAGLSAEAWSLVTVSLTPEITSTPGITVTVGETYTYAPVCNVPVSLWSLETNATFLSIDPETGEITGDVGVEDVGWYALIVRASTSSACDQAYILWVTGLEWDEVVKITVKATGLRVSASYALSDPSKYWAVRSVSWSFGDGSLDQSGATATHTYARAGTYTVTCTVTNVLDDLTLGQRNVTVAKASVPAPSGTGGNDTDGGDSGPRGSWIVLLALPMTLAVLVLVWTISQGKQRRR